MRNCRILTLLLPLVLAVACIDEKTTPDKVAVGDPLPEFSVSLSDGRTVSTADLAGKVAVVVFFNTSCPDCQRELPELQEFWNLVNEISEDSAISGDSALSGAGGAGDSGTEGADGQCPVELLLIARAEEAPSIEAYWREHSLTLAYSPQPDRRVYNLFAGSVIPRIYIAGPDGIVRFSHDDRRLPTAETLLSETASLR